MTDAELKKAVDAIAKRYSDLNIRYIRQIAEQIKAIGELNPKSLNQIAEMLRMNANLSEIVAALQRLTELTKQDVRAIMQRITEDEVMDARYLPYYAEHSGQPESEITPAIAKQYAGAEAQERLRRMTLAMAAQTDDRLDNLSNTTALAEPYRQAVDRAVLAVSENVTSYTEAMRDTVRELGRAGMQVQYESGYHRRLDTAVRQNILDATGQLAQTAAIAVGEALNYNAFEISAHAMSAPDHEPVQGHVFLVDEFYKLQQNAPSQDADGQQFAAIRRPIKEWNCGHFAYPFDTRYSKRKYTPEQLQKFIDDNKAGCVIGQKRYTLYEASQIMRRIECENRREKDTAVAAQAAGDDQLRVDCQLRINHLSGLYKQVTDASGLTPQRERMTVEGFRRAKVPENAEKVLTSDAGSGKIKSKEVKPMIRAIEQPIEQQHTGKGNPNAILTFDVELNNRQVRLLEQLPAFDSSVIISKDSVNMADLAALTAKTGHEFAMFTKGQERLIIRGDSASVNIDPDKARKLAAEGYRWSGHTHPGDTIQSMIASGGDMLVLEQFPQQTSVIYNSKGQFATFGKEE